MHSLQTKTPEILGKKRFLRKIILCGALGLLFEETSAAQSGLDSNARLCETSQDLLVAVVSSRDPRAIADPSGVPVPLSFPIPKDTPGYRALDLPGHLGGGPLPKNSMTPFESSPPRKNVFWKQAFMESLLYTGIMHSFNVTTEAGKRDTLNGHWFQHYVHSVSELRGWSGAMAETIFLVCSGRWLGQPFGMHNGRLARSAKPRSEM